jgi:tetraacyldisaccharide 4'-kinase
MRPPFINLRQHIEHQWYGKTTWLWILVPFSMLFRLLSHWRKKFLQSNAYHAKCPVIVVGNIVVGGTGKTPVLIALVAALKEAGFNPAVVARGYGRATSKRAAPLQVPHDGDAKTYGDEPILIAKNSHCPVWVAEDRAAAVQMAERHGSDVILSDDGLQHYRMGRSFELVVQDGQRAYGNGWCLPVGPLREAPIRLSSVDYVLINTGALKLAEDIRDLSDDSSEATDDRCTMALHPSGWVNVKTGHCNAIASQPWRSQTGNAQRVHAIAGIGNPLRFFDTLEQLNVRCECHSFPDHHPFSLNDFAIFNGQPVVMTAKDAVKCRAFAQPNWWYLSVQAVLPPSLVEKVIEHCKNFAPNDQASSNTEAHAKEFQEVP